MATAEKRALQAAQQRQELVDLMKANNDLILTLSQKVETLENTIIELDNRLKPNAERVKRKG